MAEWKTLFTGEKNGRPVKLEQYYEGNSLKLTTTPLDGAPSDVSERARSAQSADARANASLEIHAEDSAQLERRLVAEGGFPEDVAREIAQLGHAKSATLPPGNS